MQGDKPLMQYKVHPKSPNWMPMEGGIELWKKDARGHTLLPTSSNLLPMAEFVKDNL